MSESMEVVYLVDIRRPGFDRDRLAVDVVCAGDSITGWNNFGDELHPNERGAKIIAEDVFTMLSGVHDGA